MKPVFSIRKKTLYLLGIPKDAREALRWSIAKWKFIVANVEKLEYDGSCDTCGLCCFHQGCTLCPVRIYTLCTMAYE
jgi:hypothetical protein